MGRGEQKKCVTQHANVSITTEVISVTLVGQSASEVRTITPRQGHENDHGLTFSLAKTGAISTSKLWRRRAQDVADTTDSLRAVACIRFVRPWGCLRLDHGDVAACAENTRLAGSHRQTCSNLRDGIALPSISEI